MLANLDRLNPPLKWAGGKRWLVPHLKPLYDSYGDCRFVEPLCGGLAVTLGIMPENALLNDINVHIINFYRWLQKGLEISIQTENKKTLYYNHRERFNRLISEEKAASKEAAELFYYLNRTGYNGLCRFNQSGFFNVPFGQYKKINYAKDFSHYRAAFSNWKFSSIDFEKIPLQPTDFVYADPPYDVEFTQYSKENFLWGDQVRLAEWLVKHPGPVAISNQATDRIIKLYKEHGFTLQFLKAPRRISCDGNRAPAMEVLALKRSG